MSNRWIVALALVISSPVAAFAQFTTFIAPPNPVKDSIKAAVVAEQRAVSDSITHAQITDMKTWVDSAAGIAAFPKTSVADTMAPAVPAPIPSKGVVAPATASSLPVMLLLGVGSILIGLVMLGRPGMKPSQSGP